MRARSKNSKDDNTSTNFTWPINPPSEKEEDIPHFWKSRNT